MTSIFFKRDLSLSYRSRYTLKYSYDLARLLITENKYARHIHEHETRLIRAMCRGRWRDLIVRHTLRMKPCDSIRCAYQYGDPSIVPKLTSTIEIESAIQGACTGGQYELFIHAIEQGRRFGFSRNVSNPSNPRLLNKILERACWFACCSDNQRVIDYIFEHCTCYQDNLNAACYGGNVSYVKQALGRFAFTVEDLNHALDYACAFSVENGGVIALLKSAGAQHCHHDHNH